MTRVFEDYKLRYLLFFIGLAGVPAYADPVNIGAGETKRLSDIYGSGVGQMLNLGELSFSGTLVNPATLVADGAGTDWLFDGANTNINRLVTGSSANTVIRVEDGAKFTIRNVYNTSGSGAALYTTGDITFQGENGSVIFDHNRANTGGAAIYSVGKNITFEGHVTLNDNHAINTASGAIRTFGSGDVSFTGHNANVIISNNTAVSSGGGIFSDGDINFYGNADIFGNRAFGGTGGALVSFKAIHMEANGSSGIIVHDNYGNTQTAGAILLAGGSGASSLFYAKNSNILFYGNKTNAGSDPIPNLTSAVANAIDTRDPNSHLNIAASVGHQVLFRDPVTSFDANGFPVLVNVGINTTDGTSTGKTDGLVTFSGEDFLAGSANVKSLIHAKTTVYGGTLELKDNAEFGANINGTTFTLNSGATLRSTASGLTPGVVNKLVAQTITLADASVIESGGVSTLSLSANNVYIGTAGSLATTETVTVNTANLDSLTLQGGLTGSGVLKKTGTGTLRAGNANLFSNKGGVYIATGDIDAQDHHQSISILKTDLGTHFSMGSTGANLTITDSGSVYGALTNVQTLSKDGLGTLTIGSNTAIEQLLLNQGTLNIGANKTLTVGSGGASLATGTVLGVDISSSPAMQTSALTLGGGSTINITGYNPVDDTNIYTLISSNTDIINGGFVTTIAGNTLGSYVGLDNFMIGSAKVDDSGKNIIASLGLVWQNSAPQSAHGTFYLPEGEVFSLGVGLSNNTDASSYKFGWDGTALTKTGDGSLILNGINTYTGLTDIQNGILVVGENLNHNLSQIAGDVDVQNAARLSGHGQINGLVSIYAGGTLAPGNSSIGTLLVGEASFVANSIYQVRVEPNGAADKLVADSSLGGGSGKVNIDSGAKLKIVAGAGLWRDDERYLVIDTDQGVFGQFGHVDSNLAFLTASVDYSNPDQVWLGMARNKTRFSDVANTYNQRNAAIAVESLGLGNSIYNAVVGMDPWQAQNTFDNLSGEIHVSAHSALLTNSRYVRSAANQHLRTLPVEPGNNIWVQAWGYDGRIKNDANAQRIDNKGSGVLFGVDLPVGDAVQLGIAAGYEQTSAKAQGTRQSNADIDAYHVMLYGKTKAREIDLRGGIGYARLKLDTQRNIWVTGLQRQNSASYNGHQLQAFIEGSRTFSLNDQVSVMPYLNLSYVQIRTNGYNERGNETALNGHSKTNSMGVVTLGARGEMTLGIRQQHSIFADVGIINRFGDKTPEASFNFAGGTTYTLRGVDQGRMGALIGLGTNLEIKPHLNLMFRYESEVGSRVNAHSLNAQLEWQF